MRGAAGQPQPLERPGGQHGGESPSPRQSAPGQRAVRTSPSDGPSPISAQVSGAVCTRNVHRPGAEPAAPHPGNSLAMTLCSCTWPPVPGQDEPADGDIVICFPGDCPPPPQEAGGQTNYRGPAGKARATLSGAPRGPRAVLLGDTARVRQPRHPRRPRFPCLTCRRLDPHPASPAPGPVGVKGRKGAGRPSAPGPPRPGNSRPVGGATSPHVQQGPPSSAVTRGPQKAARGPLGAPVSTAACSASHTPTLRGPRSHKRPKQLLCCS